jgi:sigma-B regulation protein RsbU (phosphoserine phosphatase)
MIRAIIVDDEAPARERLRRMLPQADVEVVGEAADGDEAVARIEALQPDLVFLDIQMPVLSGLAVVARLRAPRPRIVFCTAYDTFAVDAFELHAVDYLLKPVNQGRLARTVQRIIAELDQQRLQTRERTDAVRTQRRLLPEDLRADSGLVCAGASEPADGVGGDYYDFLPLAGGRLGIALADVSGKGMYAGLLAAALQARLQAITAHAPESAAGIVRELNRLTVGTIEGNRFATVFFGVFDPAGTTLTYVNAGHPPAVLLSRTGETRTLDATAPAVGWMADAEFPEASVTLSPGDLFAVFSDGLTEAASPGGDELGTDGVVQIVRRNAVLTPRALVDATLADIRRFSGSASAADDRTLVVAQLQEAR